jgi:hypothetical protein
MSFGAGTLPEVDAGARREGFTGVRPRGIFCVSELWERLPVASGSSVMRRRRTNPWLFGLGSLALLGILVGVWIPAVGLLTVGGVSGQLLLIGVAGIAAGLTWLLAGAVCWQIRQACQSGVCQGTVRDAGRPTPRHD